MRVGVNLPGPFSVSTNVRPSGNGCVGCLLVALVVGVIAAVISGIVSLVHHPMAIFPVLMVAGFLGLIVWVCVYLAQRQPKTPVVAGKLTSTDRIVLIVALAVVVTFAVGVTVYIAVASSS